MAAVNLSARQLELLQAYITEVKGDVDWQKVASKANFKTAKYARDTFAGIRKNLLAATNGGNEAGDDAEGKVKTPKKRKGQDVDGNEDSPIAEKKKKATPRGKKEAKGKAEAAANNDADDEEGGVAVKEEPNEAGELMDDMTD
ncbi:hypothetical protein BDY17DRAFT_323643 [Neohortaea acidophila]|uniref:Uncharacterized protein n=1 Tax=Neohortaea acidophila TaxID=245834 RepID=A0A6A6PSW9_9PEZI|nr:uncharacterized protein BDY17DRAFT_323643 [Neohortaea acidophila]KAF2482866.1 hypothetical protein BDY17DRAFT_323643 [Neohortaea acidophila]